MSAAVGFIIGLGLSLGLTVHVYEGSGFETGSWFGIRSRFQTQLTQEIRLGFDLSLGHGLGSNK
eukprot:16162-Ditylum_brightwellii.AAC.1